jgi:hypothetical protein
MNKFLFFDFILTIIIIIMIFSIVNDAKFAADGKVEKVHILKNYQIKNATEIINFNQTLNINISEIGKNDEVSQKIIMSNYQTITLFMIAFVIFTLNIFTQKNSTIEQKMFDIRLIGFTTIMLSLIFADSINYQIYNQHMLWIMEIKL